MTSTSHPHVPCVRRRADDLVGRFHHATGDCSSPITIETWWPIIKTANVKSGDLQPSINFNSASPAMSG
jgi:hypothetical protein